MLSNPLETGSSVRKAGFFSPFLLEELLIVEKKGSKFRNTSHLHSQPVTGLLGDLCHLTTPRGGLDTGITRFRQSKTFPGLIASLNLLYYKSPYYHLITSWKSTKESARHIVSS